MLLLKREILAESKTTSKVFNCVDIKKIIVSFLQYEEILKNNTVLRVEKPIMPILTDFMIVLLNKNILTWYIPASIERKNMFEEEEEIFGAIFFLCDGKYGEFKFKLQCPNCYKYKTLEIVKKLYWTINGYSTEEYCDQTTKEMNDDPFCQSICPCIYSHIPPEFITRSYLRNGNDIVAAYEAPLTISKRKKYIIKKE